jgi:multidrug resistance efflux pump
MIRFLRKAFLPLLALAALGLAIVNVAGNYVKIDPPPPPSPPAIAPFERSVAGTGIVEARTENIAVGAHVGGVVAKVFVQVNQHVERGSPLFSIDDRQLQRTLGVRQAALQMAKAELKRLESMPRPEELVPSAAKIAEAKANLAAQEDLRNRANSLAEQHALAREESVARDMAWRAKKEQLARLEAEDALLRAGAWEADKEVARAAVAKAQAEVDQAATDIERLTVLAPVSGEVLQVNVRPGEFVAAGQGLAPVVFGDLATLHVRVDIDEHDISRFSLRGPARASVRGDPQKSYPLAFVRVEPYVVPKKSLTGDSSERVDTRVLQVIYAFAAGERSVYVGQQLDVFVDASPVSPAKGP